MPVLEWLDLDADHERLYRMLLARPELTVEELARRLGWPADTVQEHLAALVAADLVELPSGSGSFSVAPPQVVLSARIRDEETQLKQRHKELESARAAIGALVDDFVAGHQRTPNGGNIEVLDEINLVRARLFQLAQSVEREVRTIFPDREIPAKTMAASEPLDLQALSRGILVRSVWSPTALNSPGAKDYLTRLVEAGGKVRVHPGPPTRMVLVDDTFALVPVDPEDPSQGAYLLKNAALTAPLIALFQEVWSASSRLEFASAVAEEDADEGHLDDRVRLAVVMLAQGHKDAAVARRIGVSTRTVRRWLAMAMETLGADSRFELAVEATRRGWLPASTLSDDHRLRDDSQPDTSPRKSM